MTSRLLRIAMAFAVLLALATNSALAQKIELKSAKAVSLVGAERERFLAVHNDARQAVGVAAVTWSDELDQHARQWLESQQEALVAKAKEGWEKRRVPIPEHSSEDKYGENVAAWAGSKAAPAAERAATLWLGERTAFKKLSAIAPYRVGDEAGQTEFDERGQERPIIVGHYTAMIWRSTKQIGAARLDFELVDEQGEARYYTAIVCNYSPPGNRLGEKPF